MSCVHLCSILKASFKPNPKTVELAEISLSDDTLYRKNECPGPRTQARSLSRVVSIGFPPVGRRFQDFADMENDLE